MSDTKQWRREYSDRVQAEALRSLRLVALKLEIAALKMRMQAAQDVLQQSVQRLAA